MPGLSLLVGSNPLRVRRVVASKKKSRLAAAFQSRIIANGFAKAELDQPAHGFGQAWQVILFAAPILHLLHQLSPNASGRAIATMKLEFRRLRRRRRTVR